MRRHLFALIAFVALPALVFAQDVPKYPAPAEVRASFKKLLDRPKVALDAKVTATKSLGDGLVLETLSFATEKNADGSIECVPTILLRPEKVSGRMPAVIVLHGTGGNKDSQLGFMKELAKRKIIGIAIDARYHGGRAGIGYQKAITKAWQTKAGEPMEHPFYYDTVWDLWKLVDYLETRDDIDAKNLGMIGFSMGGIQTYLAASVDERVKVSVPAIAVQSFRWSLDNDRWQGRANTIRAAHAQAAKDLGEPMVNQKVCRALWNKIVPGITDEFDCPSMLRLCAGRPLLILSGTMDGNCPYEGAKIAIASVERAYKDAKASDRLSVMIEPVGHTVTAKQRTAALDWFERWLK
ncbi:MAG TPA: alpha/beta fold hydrolase [Gemmataceae bacterium]|nr:alpha/beta fold hydrolase [Gemmataceae bacterium]